MSYATLLINAIVVRRYTDGGTDAYGNPTKVWADHLSIDGRISYPKGRQVQRGTEVVPVDAVLFLEEVDVTEDDRAVVDGTTYEIVFVATLQDSAGSHHMELSLVRVKS